MIVHIIPCVGEIHAVSIDHDVRIGCWRDSHKVGEIHTMSRDGALEIDSHIMQILIWTKKSIEGKSKPAHVTRNVHMSVEIHACLIESTHGRLASIKTNTYLALKTWIARIYPWKPESRASWCLYFKSRVSFSNEPRALFQISHFYLKFAFQSNSVLFGTTMWILKSYSRHYEWIVSS